MLKPMLCSVYKEGKIPFPCLVQPKLDGVRCLVNEDEVFTRSLKPHKDHIVSMIREALADVYLGPYTLDGELMLTDGTFQDTVSAVKKLSPACIDLVYYVYDVCDIRESRWEYMEARFDRLMSIKQGLRGNQIRIVQTYYVWDQGSLDRLHENLKAEGYEGSIIRDPIQPYLPGSRKAMWKRKDFQDAEYPIIAVWEGSGKNAGTPVFRLPRPEYREGDEVTNKNSFGSVPEGSYERKRQMWQDRDRLIGSMLTVRFQELTDGGIPRFPVGVEIRDYE